MSYEFECPKCGKTNEVEPEALPDDCSSEEDFDCECGATLEIGIAIEVEVRNVKAQQGDGGSE